MVVDCSRSITLRIGSGRTKPLEMERKVVNRSYRYREPIHIFGDTFVRTVFEALQAKEITLARASGYLDNLRIQDVHELEQYCYAHV